MWVLYMRTTLSREPKLGSLVLLDSWLAWPAIPLVNELIGVDTYGQAEKAGHLMWGLQLRCPRGNACTKQSQYTFLEEIQKVPIRGNCSCNPLPAIHPSLAANSSAREGFLSWFLHLAPPQR